MIEVYYGLFNQVNVFSPANIQFIFDIYKFLKKNTIKICIYEKKDVILQRILASSLWRLMVVGGAARSNTARNRNE